MKRKRLVYALVALMLVGASFANVTTTFAEEITDIEATGDGGEAAGGETEPGAGDKVVTGGEVAGEEAAGGEHGGDKKGSDGKESKGEEKAGKEAGDKEVDEPKAAGTVNEPAGDGKKDNTAAQGSQDNAGGLTLRAAPQATNDGAVLRAGEGEGEGDAEEEAEEYDVALLLEGESVSQSVNVTGAWSMSNWNDWRCNVSPANSGMTCDKTSGGSFKATKPGKYTVTFDHFDGYPSFQWTNRYTATVVVYSLDASTTQDGQIFSTTGEGKFSYTINKDKTYGKIHTVVTRDGETIQETTSGVDDAAALEINATEEGEYKVTVENDSAIKANLDGQKKTFTFYVFKPKTVDIVAVGSDKSVEVGGTKRWGANSVVDMVTGDIYQEVDESGVLTLDELEPGLHVFLAYHTFGSAPVPVSFTPVLVYDITAADPMTEGDDYEAAADTLRKFLEKNIGVIWSIGDIDESVIEAFEELAQSIFGDDEYGEETLDSFLDNVFDGASIVTGVDYEELDESEVSEALVAKMAEYGANEVKYFDIYVWVDSNAEGYLGDIHELNGKVTIAIMETGEPEEGYERKFIVVREHNGEIEELTEGEDYFIKDGILYIYSDKFSIYAVAYIDTLVPVETTAPNTGVAIKETGSAVATNSLSVAVLAAIVTTMLAGAAIFAKRK